MQEHHAHYLSRMADANEKRRLGFYRDAIRLSKSAWDDIDGMLQFDKKYNERQHTEVSAIDMVLWCAPPLLDFASLIAVNTKLDDCKRIVRELPDYSSLLAQSNLNLQAYFQLWTFLEQNGEVLQSELRSRLGEDQDGWREKCEIWEKIGVVRRVPVRNSYHVNLLTRFGKVVSAKCPNCGKTAEAPKSMFFDKLICDSCQVQEYFVILDDA